MDLISVERCKLLHPLVRDKALKGLEFARSHWGFNRVRYFSTMRDFKEQAKLFDAYKKGGVVAAPPGLSYHNYGLAVDFCLLTPDGKSVSWSLKEDLDRDSQSDWREFAAYMQGLGFEWGGNWKGKKVDPPHLQFVTINGKRITTSKLLEMVRKGQVDEKGFVIL